MKASKEGLLLLCLSGVLALAGCENGAGDYGRSSGTETSGTEAAMEGKQTGTAAAVEAEQTRPEDRQKDRGGKYAALEALPQKYTEKMAERDGCVINEVKSIRNPQPLYDFLDAYEEGRDAMVRVFYTTVEGDPILMDVVYREGIFTVTDDYSRDAWSCCASSVVRHRFKYLIEDNGLLYLGNKTKDKKRRRLFAGIDDRSVWNNR